MERKIFAGKKVLVMGLGRFGGGVDAAKFAAKAGAKVIITDLATAEDLAESIEQLKEKKGSGTFFSGLEFHLGGHNKADFEQADIVIVNPAVSPDNEYLQIARRCNKLVTSRINIFFQLCPATTIGITGANGKSTTAALTAHLLKAGSQKSEYRSQVLSIENVWLGGNIGNQPLLEVLDQISEDDLVVLELSSFQLEQLAHIQKAPGVSLLTNLTPNHLDRHGTFENYCAAKENIFKFQQFNGDSPAVSIFNAEDKVGAEWFEKYQKDSDRICIKFSADDITEDIRAEFTLPGRANLSNLAAAIAIAGYFGIEQDQIKKNLPEFKPLPHRLELVAQINGVSWYNDSIATTPQSAIAAIDAFEQPKIIIAGGYDKGIAFDELGKKIAQSTKAAVLIGQTAKKIADTITAYPNNQAKVEITASLQKAVESANRLAESGDVVLLSPACASYDMFDNFQQRGRQFTGLVRKISG